MRVYGGLQPEDWLRWGEHTTFKQNAADLLARQLRAHQRIYCSPLTDPYQPAEASEALMPRILETLIVSPPAVFVIQTRGPLIVRDLDLLRELDRRTRLRISFSITTDRDDVRRRYEPRCESILERLDALAKLRDAGLVVHATLAPLLPCDPENLARLALDATDRDLIADPLHVRAVKPRGATTRETALKVATRVGDEAWLRPADQQRALRRIASAAEAAGRRLVVGEQGFATLAE